MTADGPLLRQQTDVGPAKPAGLNVRRWVASTWPAFAVLFGTLAALPILGIALARDGALSAGMAAHAACMLGAWGVLLPAGALLARYGKVTPGQDFPTVVHNLFWWRGHRLLQYGGMALAMVGLIAIASDVGVALTSAHATCGLAAMALGCAQIGSALLRGTAGGPWAASADVGEPSTWRGDHYDMTPRRRRFEAWHKTAGWATVALSSVTILLGTALVGSPGWLLALVGGLQGGVCLAVVDGVARRRWVDTYHALWGPDPRHPGNARRGDPKASRSGQEGRSRV